MPSILGGRELLALSFWLCLEFCEYGRASFTDARRLVFGWILRRDYFVRLLALPRISASLPVWVFTASRMCR